MHIHAPLIIDVAGFELTDTDRQRLAHPLVGGVILFGRNWQSRAAADRLCHRSRRCGADLLIAVDHEGGRVQRFRTDGFTHLPPMAAFGELWLSAPKKGEGEGGPACVPPTRPPPRAMCWAPNCAPAAWT
jgi:beta-N-acetylhexosaminidase